MTERKKRKCDILAIQRERKQRGRKERRRKRGRRRGGRGNGVRTIKR